MVAALAIISLVYPSKIHGDESVAVNIQQILFESLSDTSDKQMIKEAIVFIASKYGVDKSSMIATIECESGFNNTAIGKAGERGLAQFMPATWEYWNKERGTYLEIHRIQNQLDMMAWAFEKGYQRHWTCWKLLTMR